MLYSLLIALSVLITYDNSIAISSYDWTEYEKAEQQFSDALNRTIEAHLIIQDNLDIDINQLPEKTRKQLVFHYYNTYAEWVKAEEALGASEAANYWEEKFNNSSDGRPFCYSKYEMQLRKRILNQYQLITNCKEKTKTACILKIIQSRFDLSMEFYGCMKETYGDYSSPLKPKTASN